MSEESIKKTTKKHRKSGREDKGLKVKKGRKPGPGRAENGNDPCEGHQRLDPSIAKLEWPRAEDQLSSSGQLIPPNTPSKVKVSLGKRKRTNRDAMLDESVHFETDATELEPQRNTKRGEYREDDLMHRLPCPDPAIDASLSEQSRRALSYAYERCRGSKVWKFNKARQNWLLRNVWSEQAVPEDYIPLVIKYLVGIRGGAREAKTDWGVHFKSVNFRGTMEGAQPFDDSAAINQQPDTSRALFVLHALNGSS